MTKYDFRNSNGLLDCPNLFDSDSALTLGLLLKFFEFFIFGKLIEVAILAHAFGVDESGARMGTQGTQLAPPVLVIALIAHPFRINFRIFVSTLGYLLLLLLGMDCFGGVYSRF